MLNYFAAKPSVTPEELVCGAHMAYGWMPTILELYTKKPNIDLSIAAGLLNTAKVTGTLTDVQIEQLACLVNNSLVGASKLLHFISPHKFAIWDAKVYAFVYQEKAHNRVRNVSKYRSYLGLLSRHKQDSRFSEFHASVNDKIGYEVSPFRALELIMYLNAPAY
ncbi:MAG: hypothetical protein WCF26_00545 [Candidatus Sulfotelmatobacter sp.]